MNEILVVCCIILPAMWKSRAIYIWNCSYNIVQLQGHSLKNKTKGTMMSACLQTLQVCSLKTMDSEMRSRWSFCIMNKKPVQCIGQLLMFCA